MLKEAKRNMVKCKICQVEVVDGYIIQAIALPRVLGKFGVFQAPKIVGNYGPFCKNCLRQLEEHIKNVMRGEPKNVQKKD